MKTTAQIFLLVLSLVIPGMAMAALPELRIEVVNAEPASGSVEVSLFNSADTFMKDPYLQRSGPVSEDGSFSVSFSALPEGDYAIVVVHDENDNGKLDTGLLGFGGESWRYSNNAGSLFGRPDFEDAKFTFTEDLQIDIDLQ